MTLGVSIGILTNLDNVNDNPSEIRREDAINAIYNEFNKKSPCESCENSSYFTRGSNIMKEPCFSCIDTGDYENYIKHIDSQTSSQSSEP
jgi:hypothetical protein